MWYWIRAFENYADKQVTSEPPCAVERDAEAERIHEEGLPGSLPLLSFPLALPSLLVIALSKLFGDISRSVEGGEETTLYLLIKVVCAPQSSWFCPPRGGAETIFYVNSWTQFLLVTELSSGNYLHELLGVNGGP